MVLPTVVPLQSPGPNEMFTIVAAQALTGNNSAIVNRETIHSFNFGINSNSIACFRSD
jgi:hypothetical protein